MGEITLEKRKEQTEKIVDYFIRLQGEYDVKDEELIIRIYNSAVKDILDAIGVFADSNAQYRREFLALKAELENWKLVTAEELSNETQS